MIIKKIITALVILCIVVFGSIAAGDEFSFEVIPSTQILNVGDTLILTVKITILGNSDNIEVEPLSKLELVGFETIATSPRHRKGINNDIAFEERITTFKMIAREEGSHIIPSFQIPYTDTNSGEETFLTSQELEINVKSSATLGKSPNTIYMIGVFIAVVLISVGGFLFWMRRIKSKQFKEEEDQNIKTKFSIWAEDLQKLLSSGKKDTFTEQAFNYVNEFIEDNYRLGLKGKKIEKRLKLIADKNVPSELVDLFKLTHNYLDEFRFGGIVKESSELSDILSKLKDIEKYIIVER